MRPSIHVLAVVLGLTGCAGRDQVRLVDDPEPRLEFRARGALGWRAVRLERGPDVPPPRLITKARGEATDAFLAWGAPDAGAPCRVTVLDDDVLSILTATRPLSLWLDGAHGGAPATRLLLLPGSAALVLAEGERPVERAFVGRAGDEALELRLWVAPRARDAALALRVGGRGALLGATGATAFFEGERLASVTAEAPGLHVALDLTTHPPVATLAAPGREGLRVALAPAP